MECVSFVPILLAHASELKQVWAVPWRKEKIARKRCFSRVFMKTMLVAEQASYCWSSIFNAWKTQSDENTRKWNKRTGRFDKSFMLFCLLMVVVSSMSMYTNMKYENLVKIRIWVWKNVLYKGFNLSLKLVCMRFKHIY